MRPIKLWISSQKSINDDASGLIMRRSRLDGVKQMKNPWMSAYLSAANQMTSAARGQMMAEASKQQTTMMEMWTEQMTQMWMQMMFPWLPKQK